MRVHVAGSGIRNRGFTLVEILVVMIIMAIVISMAVLSIGVTGRDTQLDQEGQRIEGLLNLLHDRATLEGRDFGMRVLPNGYEFVYYDTRLARWRRLDQDREFRHRDLPAGVSFQLELDSQVVVLKPIDPNLIDDTAPPPPQIAVAASGDATPFRLSLLRADTQARVSVSSDTNGKLTMQSSDHPQAEKKT
jgi:general secretion pathway protein H